MKLSKRILSLLAALVISVQLLCVPAFADTPFINNDHWKEITISEVNSLYSQKSSFVVMFYQTTCQNSNMRKIMLSEWMTKYNFDIYGVAITNNIPSWAYSGGSVTLPVICIVENGNADRFTAKDSMRSILERLQAYLGVSGDGSAADFSALNAGLYNSYSVHSNTVGRFTVDASTVNSAIRSQAATIVASASTDREKLKAIYDWVTTNIYYDYGMLNGDYAINATAEYTYTYKRSVCSGYANLTAALCHAAGIPCRVVTGYATGVGTEVTVDKVWAIYNQYLKDGDLSALDTAMTPYENHAWNEAFVDGRWVILDTTWGSNNDYYSSGGRITGTPTDLYFDPDFEWFSDSHLFWTDYSIDLSTTLSGNRLTVSGALDTADIAASSYFLLVSYDASGRVLESAILQRPAGTVSHILTASSNAARVAIYLLDSQYAPTTTPYLG